MKNIQIARRASAVLYDFLKSTSLPKQVYLLPANICPVVPAVFCKLNIAFKFVDISLSTYCIDWEACLKIAKEDTDNKYNLLYVHSYGYVDPVFNQHLKKWKEQLPDSIVIDDRCLIEPSLKKQNALSDIELYSTGYSKLLEIGHTGWAIYNTKPKEVSWSNYNDAQHDALVKSFHDAFEVKEKVIFDFSSEWLDERSTEVCSDDILKKIEEKLTQSLIRRLTLNEIYTEHLKEWAMPSQYNKWRFNILTPHAAKLMRTIFNESHFASRHYQSVAIMFGQKEVLNASLVGNQIVNLFNDYRYDEQRAEALAILIKKQLSTNL
mgnify:CR=1 FL=1|tara:strand:+ start:4676 stop:5641 length:966 start_codon:yes stop_codon:yes gene_type:complete